MRTGTSFEPFLHTQNSHRGRATDGANLRYRMFSPSVASLVGYTGPPRLDESTVVKTFSIFLLWCAFALGQSSPIPSAEKRVPDQEFGVGVGAKRQPVGSVDLLSDTQGVDFGPYLSRILPIIRQNWLHLIPASAETRKGRLAIEFAIKKDGNVANMHLVTTSGDVVLDRPAWISIASSNPFPSLPSEFTGPFLALRLHFYYNPDKSTLTVIEVSITASAKLQVPVGGSEVVTATVKGTQEKAVEWTVTGPGCSGTACGEMNGDLYVAPSVSPDPPVVTLTAVSKADPKAHASVTVHIVQRTPSH